MLMHAKAGVHHPNPKYALAAATSTMSASISLLPSSARVALRDDNWKDAMQADFDALMHKQTWTLVDRPPAARIIAGKWVFEHKLRSDGTLECYKARSVVRGFNQRPSWTLARRSHQLLSLPPSGPCSPSSLANSGPRISSTSPTPSPRAPAREGVLPTTDRIRRPRPA